MHFYRNGLSWFQLGNKQKQVKQKQKSHIHANAATREHLRRIFIIQATDLQIQNYSWVISVSGNTALIDTTHLQSWRTPHMQDFALFALKQKAAEYLGFSRIDNILWSLAPWKWCRWLFSSFLMLHVTGILHNQSVTFRLVHVATTAALGLFFYYFEIKLA